MQTTAENASNDPLRNSREQLDEVDYQILELLKRRTDIVSVIAQVKKDKSLAAHQPERYKAMLERLQAKAAKMSLDEQLVKEFWDAVHAASLRQQKRVIDLS